MTVSIVRLGSPRLAKEGPRIGTVRFPPRDVIPPHQFLRRLLLRGRIPLPSVDFAGFTARPRRATGLTIRCLDAAGTHRHNASSSKFTTK